MLKKDKAHLKQILGKGKFVQVHIYTGTKETDYTPSVSLSDETIEYCPNEFTGFYDEKVITEKDNSKVFALLKRLFPSITKMVAYCDCLDGHYRDTEDIEKNKWAIFLEGNNHPMYECSYSFIISVWQKTDLDNFDGINCNGFKIIRED